MVVQYGLGTLICLLGGIFAAVSIGYVSYQVGRIKGMMEVMDFDKKVTHATREPSGTRYKHEYKRRAY